MSVEIFDMHGLIRLLLALQKPCECEDDGTHDDCREAPLDRWWAAMITGRAA